MAKAKNSDNSGFKTVKKAANYFTVTVAILYGLYWAIMGITGANPTWGDTVGNILLVGIVVGAMTMGLAGALQSVRNKNR